MPRSTLCPCPALFRSGLKTDLVEQMADIKDELKAEEAALIAQAPTMPLEEAKIGRAGQQECRDRHSVPARRSSDLDSRPTWSNKWQTSRMSSRQRRPH